MSLVKSHVILVLDLLEVLFNEIIWSCQELMDFATKYDQVHSDEVASVQQKLQQNRESLNDFEERQDPQTKLIPNPDNVSVQWLSTSLVMHLPVTFNRIKSGVISNSKTLTYR